jgi:Ca2+-binding RTX toxin-like protein
VPQYQYLQYIFSDGGFLAQPINGVTTSDGSNLPPPVGGDFNIELVTNPARTSYSLPAGYQVGATFPGGTGKQIDLVAGDVMLNDAGQGDVVVLGTGNDTVGAGTADTIYGGSGTQVIAGLPSSPGVVIFGGTGQEELIGYRSSITGGSAGSDTILSSGLDTITGGSGGTDLIESGVGDTVYGGGANDTILAGYFWNPYVASSSGEYITGGTGSEFINGVLGNPTIAGGSAGNEIIWGGSGDLINGGSGANVTIGGAPGDTITGGSGPVFIDASRGNQSIAGGSAGNETIWAGAGDTINGGGAANETIGGVPSDTITGGTGSEFIDGGQGQQLITTGSAGFDSIWGGTNDTFVGGAGGQGLIGFVTTTGAQAEFFSDSGMTASNATDSIGGFSQANGDFILLNGQSATPVVASAQTANGNTTINFADGSKLTLLGITSINSSFFH